MSDPERRTDLAAFGVHMAGATVRGDLVDGPDAMYCLPDEPTDLAMAAAGNSRALAEAAAAWHPHRAGLGPPPHMSPQAIGTEALRMSRRLSRRTATRSNRWSRANAARA
ncbi:hypothetical protein ACFV1L_08505 [Kitasatospora sp. NPDC059646]|uniref:hypothetical protein n=1 Tax=Kitasatospora sp. NPDC059646 TaxID=3346893 RepID=UPI00367C9647